MLKPTRPLYLAKNFQELNKLVTKQSHGKKLGVLYRASDKLAQNVFDTHLALPVDEEKLFILAMRYINLITVVRAQVQDERFFSMRFAPTLRKVEEIKLEMLKSLTLRYEMITGMINDKVPAHRGLEDGASENTRKSSIIGEDDVYITSHQLYALMNDKGVKLLVMDARSSGEFSQCALKFANVVSIPEEIIQKGLSTNTLQQKLAPAANATFQTRHDFDYIVLADRDTNKISYQTTKLHDLRTILVEWDPAQRYHTLPLILEGGVRAMVDNYPTLLTNPGAIFNQLFTQLDDLMQDDIEYPDMQTLEPAVRAHRPPPALPTKRGEPAELREERADCAAATREEEEEAAVLEELETSAGDKDGMHAAAQRLLTIREHQVQLEDRLLELTRRRLEAARGGARHALEEIRVEIDAAESRRLELEERGRLARADFDARAQRQDASHLDFLLGDVGALERRRLVRYQRRKLLEQEEGELARARPRLPVPDRTTKPPAANALQLELSALLASYPSTGVAGQVNIKNTCYMNALVQCLRFCPSVAYYLTTRTFPTGSRLTGALSALMKRLWAANGAAVRPQEFYAECCRLAARDYSTGEHEDIHEFFLNVTDAVHKELAEPLESAGDCTSCLADWHRHFKSRISFVKRAFFYQLEVTARCARCRSCVVRYEYDNNVFLTMECDQQRPIDVQREVDKLVRPGRDAGALKYCSRCEVEMSVAHRITYYPNVLVVNIMRYTYSARERCVLRSPNEAHFSLELAFGGARYALSAIACHSGNRDRGHYTACCFHPAAQKWFEFNDETCSVANAHEPGYRVRAFLLFYSLPPAHDGINRQFFH